MTFGGYRVMWVMVMFDLPVLTKLNRKDYSRFRKRLLENGFNRLQYSVYARPCPSEENAGVHRKRVERCLPPEGQVRILLFTDKQFERMEIFFGKMPTGVEQQPQQLSFF